MLSKCIQHEFEGYISDETEYYCRSCKEREGLYTSVTVSQIVIIRCCLTKIKSKKKPRQKGKTILNFSKILINLERLLDFSLIGLNT